LVSNPDFLAAITLKGFVGLKHVLWLRIRKVRNDVGFSILLQVCFVSSYP
ncbi:hypothetical protein LINPERHAP1_LOCUS13319, partial [Linum perenne]